MDHSINCSSTSINAKSDESCIEIAEEVTDSGSSKILEKNDFTIAERSSSIETDQTCTSSDLVASASTAAILPQPESELDIFANSNQTSFTEKLKRIGRYIGNRIKEWKEQTLSSNQVPTLDPSKHSTGTEVLVLDYASDITGFYKIKIESSDNMEVGIEAKEEYDGKYEQPSVPIRMVHKDFFKRSERITPEVEEKLVKFTSFNGNFSKWSINKYFSKKSVKEFEMVNSDLPSPNVIDVNWKYKSSAPINIPKTPNHKREKLNQERFQRFRPMEEDALHFDLRVKPQFRRPQVQNVYEANKGRNCEYIFVSETSSKVIKVDKEKIALLASKSKLFKNFDYYNNISGSEEKTTKQLLSLNSEENVLDSHNNKSSKLLIPNAAKLFKIKELFIYFRLKSMVNSNKIFKKKKLCLRLSRKSKLPAMCKNDIYSLFSDISFTSRRKGVLRRMFTSTLNFGSADELSTVGWYPEASTNKKNATKYSTRLSLPEIYNIKKPSKQDATFTLRCNTAGKSISKIEGKNQDLNVIPGNCLSTLSPTNNIRTIIKSKSYPGNLENSVLVASCNSQENILAYKGNSEVQHKATTLVNKCLIDSTSDSLSAKRLEKVQQKKVDLLLEIPFVGGESKHVSDYRKEKTQNPQLLLSVEEREAGFRTAMDEIAEDGGRLMNCPMPRLNQLVKEDKNKETPSN